MYNDTIKFWLDWWNGLGSQRGKKVGLDYATALASDHLLRNSVKILDEYHTLNVPIESFLELGCGSGRNIHVFHNELPHVEYTGVDIVPTLHFEIRRAFPDVLSFADIVISDALTFLRDTDRSWDLVFTYGFLMHIPDDVIDETIGHIKRVSNKIIMVCEVEDDRESGYKWFRNYENYFSGKRTKIDRNILTIEWEK